MKTALFTFADEMTRNKFLELLGAHSGTVIKKALQTVTLDPLLKETKTIRRLRPQPMPRFIPPAEEK